jgi:hypothetical protein
LVFGLHNVKALIYINVAILGTPAAGKFFIWKKKEREGEERDRLGWDGMG